MRAKKSRKANTMNSPTPPSPVKHPNAYAGGLTGMITAMLVYECNTRLGLDITELEAATVVALVTSAVLFLGKKRGSK